MNRDEIDPYGEEIWDEDIIDFDRNRIWNLILKSNIVYFNDKLVKNIYNFTQQKELHDECDIEARDMCGLQIRNKLIQVLSFNEEDKILKLI